MSETGIGGALQVCAMRVAILDTNGTPLVGAGDLYVSDALILLTAAPEIATGDDFEQKNGCGEVCVTYKSPDTIKRLNMDMQLCTPDPELFAMLTGGTVFTKSGQSVGYQPTRVGVAQSYSVSIEAWCRNIVSGRQDSTHPWVRFVYPSTKWQVGARTLQNQPVDNILTGQGEENPSWYDGPAHDWFTIADQTIESVFGHALDTDIPDTALGVQTSVAS